MDSSNAQTSLHSQQRSSVKSPLCDLSDGGVGVGGSLSEHIQWQGAHYLVFICLPTITRASQSHSSSGRNAGPSSRMPWSPQAGSTFPHLFHSAVPAQDDLTSRNCGRQGSLPGLVTCRQTNRHCHSLIHRSRSPLWLHPGGRSTSVVSLVQVPGGFTCTL